MIIFCEECGERYVIEQNEIKEKVIIFNCRICRDLLKVRVPGIETVSPADSEQTAD